MMHVPTGPDGERERSWMTAGVLCVHGAEQGETLYGTAQHSLSLSCSLIFSPPPFLSLTHKYTQNQEFSVELSTSLP